MPNRNDHKLDKFYTAPTDSLLIAKLQKLLEEPSKGFEWTKMVDQAEVRFIYDLVSRAKEDSLFVPSQKQQLWAATILTKIDGSKKLWLTKYSQKQKTSSVKEDWVARKKAKDYLRAKSIRFEKQNPSDKELLDFLVVDGALDSTSNGHKPIDRLIEWSKR